MSDMTRYDRALGDWLEERLQEVGIPAEKIKMFGHETWFLNTHMFSGGNEDGIFVHIGKEAVDEALGALEHVDAFSPGRGVVMKDYLVLKHEIYEDDAAFVEWLQKSAEYLLAKPPKVKKKRAKK
jgi:hypothetical protein